MTERLRPNEGNTQNILNEFYKDKFPPVPQGLTEAYKEYLGALPVDHQEIRIGSNLGVFTQKDLVEHFEADDDLGRLVAHDVFIGAKKDEMIEEGIENPSDEQVLERTIEGFKNAAKLVREKGLGLTHVDKFE